MSGRQRSPARKLLLGGAEGGQIFGPGIDTVFGEVTFHHQDLASAAQCPATTDGIHVNAKRTRRLEEGGSDREAATLP